MAPSPPAPWEADTAGLQDNTPLSPGKQTQSEYLSFCLHFIKDFFRITGDVLWNCGTSGVSFMPLCDHLHFPYHEDPLPLLPLLPTMPELTPQFHQASEYTLEIS